MPVLYCMCMTFCRQRSRGPEDLTPPINTDTGNHTACSAVENLSLDKVEYCIEPVITSRVGTSANISRELFPSDDCEAKMDNDNSERSGAKGDVDMTQGEEERRGRGGEGERGRGEGERGRGGGGEEGGRGRGEGGGGERERGGGGEGGRGGGGGEEGGSGRGGGGERGRGGGGDESGGGGVEGKRGGGETGVDDGHRICGEKESGTFSAIELVSRGLGALSIAGVRGERQGDTECMEQREAMRNNCEQNRESGCGGGSAEYDHNRRSTEAEPICSAPGVRVNESNGIFLWG